MGKWAGAVLGSSALRSFDHFFFLSSFFEREREMMMMMALFHFFSTLSDGYDGSMRGGGKGGLGLL